MRNYVNVSDMLGKTLVDIQGSIGDNELIFICDDESQYRMYHDDDYCGTVYLQDIIGDLSDILFKPLLPMLLISLVITVIALIVVFFA